MKRDTRPRIGIGLMALALASAAAAADPPQADQTPQPTSSETKRQKPDARALGIILYEGFEPLDVYGPVEVFGNVGPRLKVHMIAEKPGPVKSVMGSATVAEFGFDNAPDLDLILVPGGNGTLRELRNEVLHDWLRQRAEKAEIVMSVCSGSAILARAGLLDGRKATTNKRSFKLLTAPKSKVEWVKQARWVDEGDRVTSSGVSAGIDMALHVVERLWGKELAERIADGTEYLWNRDADHDPFAK